MRGVGKLIELVDPVLVWQVFHPPVASAAMVGNHVHDDLNTFLVRFLYHLLVELVATVTRIYVVIVGASITMV